MCSLRKISMLQALLFEITLIFFVCSFSQCRNDVRQITERHSDRIGGN